MSGGMDFQPLIATRPLTRLLTETLESFLTRPSERLVLTAVDALQIAALGEQTPHHHLLEVLCTKLSAAPPHGSTPTPSASAVSLPVARRLLAVQHRFPIASTDALYTLSTSPPPSSATAPRSDLAIASDERTALAASLTSTAAARLQLESIVVQRHVLGLATDIAGASDLGLVWSLLTQCESRSHREALIRSFSLVECVAGAGPDEWCAIVSQLSYAPSPVPFTSGCEDVLRDVLGADALWTRALGLLDAARTSAPQRASLVTTMLSLSQALKQWPQHAHVAGPPLSTLNAGSLYVVCHHLHALSQAWMPESVKKATETALQVDLWRVYMDRDVDGVVMFLFYGMSAWAPRARLSIMRSLDALHTRALAGQVGLQLGAVQTTVRLDTYVAILMVSLLCRGKRALADADLAPYWTGLSHSLQRRSPPTSSPSTASEAQAVRGVRPLLATYLAILLEYAGAAGDGVIPPDRQEVVSVLSAACRQSLSKDVLVTRGSARVLSLLLTHAPTVASQLDIGQTSVDLVCAHALTGGFTRQQLECLIEPRAEKDMCSQSSLLSDDVRHRLTQAAALLPQRAL